MDDTSGYVTIADGAVAPVRLRRARRTAPAFGTEARAGAAVSGECGGRWQTLDRVRLPSDLRALPRDVLAKLAAELRDFLLVSVGRTGGHLASNLGTVELTVALHRVLDTPRDRIVWDVGHQSYAHKVLTGRRELMAGLRARGGISGFPRRDESPYDTFGTAHAGTSISAALGMAVAAARKGEDRRVVAVIGDGAMSAGMAFEALNAAGAAGVDLLVVLNDNDMSISPPVGALSLNFAAQAGRTRLAPDVAGGAPGAWGGRPPSVFEAFGFDYRGPVDGHDLDALIPALEASVAGRGPRLLHVLTRKGQGYAPAEADPIRYHGVSRFSPDRGLPPPRDARSFARAFGDWMCDTAACDRRLVGITPAMAEGSALVEFAARHPDRYFDVGIAEQHAVTFAAGLACEGLKPVVAIYSTFLQRAFDQFVHDVQLQRLPVLFAIDRAGLAGADGSTHHGAFDIAFLRCVPELTLMVPADEAECRRMLATGYALDTPAAVRYPRGAGPAQSDAEAVSADVPLAVGRGRVVREGGGVAILAFGPLLHAARAAGDVLGATVVDMRFVKPLDSELVLRLAGEHDLLVTVEDGSVMGGAGSAVAEALAANRSCAPLLQLGLPDRFVGHGEQADLLAELGLDPSGIVAAVRARVAAAGDRP